MVVERMDESEDDEGGGGDDDEMLIKTLPWRLVVLHETAPSP